MSDEGVLIREELVCRLLHESLEAEQAVASEAAGANRALEAQVAALEAAATASGISYLSAGSSSEAVAQNLRETVAELEKQLQAMRRVSSGRCA